MLLSGNVLKVAMLLQKGAKCIYVMHYTKQDNT